MIAAVLFSALFFSGCAVGPKYSRPNVNVPTDFRGEEGRAQQASYADQPWWEVFKDDELKALIDAALANNYDLAIAVSRVEQARQMAAVARSQFLPFVNYSVGASDGKNEFLGAVAPGAGTVRGSFLAAGSVAWEADIWGRIRRLNESARAQYLSTEEARRGVLLSLTSEVAQAYFQLLGLELQHTIANETTGSFGDTLKLFNQRYEGGVASKLDTSRAEAAQAGSAANIPEFERQIALQENVISVLLGSNPHPIVHTAKLLDEIVHPDIPVGLPSALLERRPDVLAAEQQVRAANAQVGVAIANFFPQIDFHRSPLDRRARHSLSRNYRPAMQMSESIACGQFYAAPSIRRRSHCTEARCGQFAAADKAGSNEQTALNAFTDVSTRLHFSTEVRGHSHRAGAIRSCP